MYWCDNCENEYEECLRNPLNRDLACCPECGREMEEMDEENND